MIFEVIVLNLREKNVPINLSIIQLHKVACGGYTLSWHTNEYNKYIRIAKSDNLILVNSPYRNFSEYYSLPGLHNILMYIFPIYIFPNMPSLIIDQSDINCC